MWTHQSLLRLSIEHMDHALPPLSIYDIGSPFPELALSAHSQTRSSRRRFLKQLGLEGVMRSLRVNKLSALVHDPASPRSRPTRAAVKNREPLAQSAFYP